MNFNSVQFLFLFLPAALSIYLLVPYRFRNGVLAAESLIFYSIGNIRFLPLLLLLVTLDYAAARRLEREDAPAAWEHAAAQESVAGREALGTAARRALFLFVLFLNLALLFLFKYGDYLISLMEKFGEYGFSTLTVFDVLPLGISYYTLKLLSYVIDVYTGKCRAERDLVTFTAYAAMYPQLIIGPIVRYRDAAPDLHKLEERVSADKFTSGAEMFVFGLAKKVILADSLAVLWEAVAGSDGAGFGNVSSGLAWIGVCACSLRLYLDFSGCSEMSNGLSLMMGIRCRPNFDHPYCAGNFSDFWNRWHISLTHWFRDYIYIPLGGNRKGKGRQLFNMFVVWVVTAFWHGVTPNFLAWGMLNYTLTAVEKLGFRRFLDRHGFLSHLYVVFFSMLGWSVFSLPGTGISTGEMLQKLLVPQNGIGAGYYVRCYGILLVLSAVTAAGLFEKLWEKTSGKPLVRAILFCLLLLLSVAYLIGQSNLPALYASF
ncbi:MAG: MBOAT family O-acyltransferase [Anaerovoracaceae bacterium]|jgi:D-alanyl-lipoteichoic acid acyltransferase DltB (MBOAT superfamily)